MEDGVGSTLRNLLKSPLGIISGGRGFKGIFSKNEQSEETEEALKEELITILDEEEGKGAVNLFEKEMIKRVLKLYETKAKEIMIPRTSVFAVNIEDDVCDIIDEIIEERYSRVPVYEKDIDNIIGVVHIKDLFAQMRKGNIDCINLRGIMKQPYFVHEYKSIDEIFLEMQKNRTHMALVIDEYGGFSGIITIEDLVEEIFGDIEDEHDNTSYISKQIDEREYVLSARLEIEKVNETYGLDLPESDDYLTVGGLILNQYQSFPKLHELVRVGRYQFKIIKVTATKIELVRLKVME